MVSMVDATFFTVIYQLHEVSGIESMITEYKPSKIIVLNASRSSVSRRSLVNEGGGESLFPQPFFHFHTVHCWVCNTIDRTNPAQYLWNQWKVVFESLPPLTSQYLPWQRSRLIFNNRSPSGIGVGTNNPFTCPSSASPSPSYPSSVLHFLHSKELRQYKLDENLLVFCRKKLNL